jgi:hypothetical protein
MPSIQDVADQINARLDQITTHTSNTAQNTADTVAVAQDIRNQLTQANTRLSQIDATLANGFANLSQGLFAIRQVELATLHVLDHMRRQNDTIICELVNANTLLCNIVHKFGKQLQLSEATLTSVKRIEGISERAHCCEAGDYDRQLELVHKLQECCPPKPTPEEPCPETCKPAIFREPPSTKTDWTPLPSPQRPDPIG